jgi:hypothetical protein
MRQGLLECLKEVLGVLPGRRRVGPDLEVVLALVAAFWQLLQNRLPIPAPSQPMEAMEKMEPTLPAQGAAEAAAEAAAEQSSWYIWKYRQLGQ